MMFIGEAIEKNYADLLQRGIVKRENLIQFIMEVEGCSLDDAEEIATGAIDRLD